jgi:uncharacterized membrane protein YhaH (DUF805 family)
MLHNILGFGGRLGRLEFFLSCVGLGFLVMLLILALLAGFAPHFGRGATSLPPGLMVARYVLVMPIYLWFGLALQAKRLRDMGWNPLYVIPGSIAGSVILSLLSPFVPGLAVLNAVLSILMTLCLLFWPSQPADDGDWYGDSYHDGSVDPERVIDRAPASKSRRPATVRTSAPPPVFTPAPSGFGRRGL